MSVQRWDLWPDEVVPPHIRHARAVEAHQAQHPQPWAGQADYPAISRCSLEEVCELLGLRPDDVGTIHINPEYVLVTGRDNQQLRLPVVPDV